MSEQITSDSNIHSGHRQRMKSQFVKEGLDSFADHNVLEMLLYYTIPRYDTNEIAHELMNTFGSLSGVLDADLSVLEEVPGIGHESAVLIKFANELVRRYSIDKVRDVESITDSEAAAAFLRPYFITECEEMFMVVLLDACFGVKKVAVIDRGNEESVAINVKRIIREAINSHATGIICAHSHPNGFALPSREDIDVTLELCKKLEAVNINMCDHLIFSRTEVCCMSKEPRFIDTSIFSFSKS